MASRNVTLSLPEDLVRRARVLAAERDTSMSALVGELLSRTLGADESYEEAWNREEAFMTQGRLRIGDRPASRDELHRR